MNSLHDHVSGDHSGVRFHPTCPICREQRVLGRLPAGSQGPPRGRAAILAAALAASSLGLPNAALGHGTPAHPASVGDNQGPSDGENVPTGEEPESGPDDGLPASDPGAEGDQDPQGGNLISPDAPTQPAPPAHPPTPPPHQQQHAPAQAAPAMPQPGAEAAPAPPPAAKPPPVATPKRASEPANKQTKRPAHAKSHHSKRRVRPGSAPGVSSPAVSAPQTVAPSPPPAPAPTAPATQTSVQPAAATPGATHVVKSGESLWVIAQNELGKGASNAAIAHYVQQLWALNASHIASHDPDQLAVGETLRLPKR